MHSAAFSKWLNDQKAQSDWPGGQERKPSTREARRFIARSRGGSEKDVHVSLLRTSQGPLLVWMRFKAAILLTAPYQAVVKVKQQRRVCLPTRALQTVRDYAAIARTAFSRLSKSLKAKAKTAIS